MKSVDERLRAAARDAARIFPADGDLPPLRLPARTRRRVRPSAALGPHRTRAWLAPLSAAAAVAIVSAGIVVAHQAASKPGGPAPAGTRGHVLGPRREQQQRALDALVVESVAPATGPQYDRGTKLVWLIRGREGIAAARCMAAAGFHISGKSAPFNPAAFADNTQMPDLPRIARTHEFVGGAGLRASHGYSRAEQRAYRTCMIRAAVPFRRLIRLDRVLSGYWWKIVMRIQASGKVRAAIPALSRCAAKYGFPSNPYGNAPGPIKSFADFMDWVAGFLDGAGSRGAPASKMRALERHWTRIFVTCARPIVGDFQRLQLAAQPGFLSRNAAQLRQLDRLAWRLLGRHLA